MGSKRKPGPSGHAQQKPHKKRSQGGKASKPGRGNAAPPPPPRQDSGFENDDTDSDVAEEDLDFVAQYSKRLGFLRDLDGDQLDRAVQDKQRAQEAARQQRNASAASDTNHAHDDDDNDEAPSSGNGGESDDDAAEYERKPRGKEQEERGKSLGLPTKTATGQLVFDASTSSRRQQREQQRLLASKLAAVAGVSIEDEATDDAAALLAPRLAESRQAAAALIRSDEAKQQQLQQKQQQQQKQKEQPGGLPPALLSLLAIRDQHQRREALKQQMALAAQHILAEPEKHLTPGVRTLLACSADEDGQVARLALLSLLAVFKDVLPGYRIRSLSEEEKEMRVSKEVAALQEHEAALLRCYQAYLKALLAAATSASTSHGVAAGSAAATRRVAVRCMGQLLVARPGFNYSSDLLQALVPLMADGQDLQICESACAAISRLLLDDVQGKTALEAVQLVADLVKRRRCVLQPRAVSCLLVLKFESMTPTVQGGEGAGAGKAKQLSKKARRKAKRRSESDRDFDEGQAGPNVQEVALLQSQMLEALFETFFRVLKHCTAAVHATNTSSDVEAPRGGELQLPWPAARVARRFPLLQPSLSGLGQYSHLISVDYFNDIIIVLQELLASGALPLRERLGVLLAALDILRGQGESLTIDRRAILSHLYGSLLLVPLQPLYEPQGGNGSSKGRGGDDSDSEDNEALHAAWQSVLGLVGGGSAAAAAAAAAAGSGGSGDASAGVPTSVLLARALEAQLLGSKQSDAGRLAAFVKRLVGLLLHAPTGEALGAATVAWRAGRRYGRLAALLEWEGGAPVGGVAYDADATDPSEAGGLAGALWELPLAVKHYHPHVAAAARALLQLGPGTGAAGAGAGGTAAIIGGAAGPQEVAAAYEVPRHGGFRPAPPQPPRSAAPSSNGKARGRAAAAVRQAAAVAPLCEELQCVVDSSAVSAGPDIGDVAAAAAAHYDLTLQHSLNQCLRRQALLEARRLELFEQHLKTRGSRNDAPNAAGGRLNFAQALQRSGRVTKHSRTAPIT